MKFDLAWGGLHKIISGGQTGADQGGLMAAWLHNVETGGKAPLDYKTQSGFNPLLKTLGLSQGSDYSGRTKTNIDDSDGTVIIAHNMNSPGTMLTRSHGRDTGKPLLELNIANTGQLILAGSSVMSDVVLDHAAEHSSKLCDWVITNQIQILNVAGNREIQSTGRGCDVMIVHKVAEHIVCMALNKLKVSGLVVTKSDKLGF